jgi:hypothetical protein
MEWLVLALFVLAASAFIALPRRDAPSPSGASDDELAAERDSLLLALRQLDEDAEAGRITAEDRLAGRRVLGPRLREATEALRHSDGTGTS